MPLTEAELDATWALYWSDDERSTIALEILLQHYSHLATYFARQAIARAPVWQDSEDLLSYAQQGLLKAIGSYDPDRGAKFETWATRTIPKRIMDGQRQMDPLKRPDRALVKLLASAYDSLWERTQQEPTTEALADEMRVSVERVRHAQLMSKSVAAALNSTGHQHTDTGYGDIGFGDNVGHVQHEGEVAAEIADARAYLARRLASLGERGRSFVLAYYCDSKTITDIARETPVSPDWARLTRNQVWDALTG